MARTDEQHEPKGRSGRRNVVTMRRNEASVKAYRGDKDRRNELIMQCWNKKASC
jgi:hypothetical protein